MSALTSLLVRDRVVPVSKIEEALQSQVFLGGDIEIILLEMNVLPEDVLSAYRAALYDLLPATREEVMKASREALRRVPRELARSLGILPMQYESGGLIVAAWEPLPAARLREVEAQLGCAVTVRIVNQARLAAGLAHHYAFELDPRMRRLAEAMRRREPGVVPFVRPPNPAMVRPLANVQRGSEPEERPSDPAEEVSMPQHSPSVLEEAYIDVEAETMSSSVLHAEGVTGDAHEASAQGRSSGIIEAGLSELVERDSGAPAEALGSEEGARDVEASDEEKLPPGVSAQLAQLVAGPVSRERAGELLRHASQRDDVLYVLLRYVQQLFDCVCIFAVTKEGARARMAHGAGIDRTRVQEALVALPSAGLVGQAVSGRVALVGQFGAAPEEAQAAQVLKRTSERQALTIPVLLNGRAVLVLLVERVRPGISVEDAGVVTAIVPAVVDALRRIILDGKQRRSDSAPPPPASASSPAPAPESAAAPVPVPVAEESSAQAADDESAQFSAVDLDTFERLARNEAGWEHVAPPLAKTASSPREAPVARERLPGVPRAAPPPPSYEAPVVARVTNGYRARPAPSAPEEGRQSTEIVVANPRGESTQLEKRGSSPEGARGRLSLIEPAEQVPSVIIDMGESVETLIEQLLQAPPGHQPAQVNDLLHIGESVLPVLMQRFPGPLWFDRSRPYKRRPRGRDVSAIAYTIAAFGEAAAPYLASLLASSDPDRCFYALMVAGEITHNDLIDPVARRVLDRDDSLRLLALEVLRSYSSLPQYDVVMRAIAELTERPGKDPRRQRLAVEALGELRDPRALRTLLSRLADRDEQVAHAAHRALVVLTGQDFGLAQRKWESWAEGWGRAHRVEWLIESLLHPDEPVRTLAGEELKQLTQQYFGYHPALPRRDRELAQRKYREWWELEGRLAMFAASVAR